MRFVSLFAGVGGFDLGFEQAGMTCVGQVEIDRNARGILDKHWPMVPKHDDVTTAIDWADEIGLTGNVELVCGGFPCQDVSVAGRRAGLAGQRSGLFWDAINFARHVQARWIVLENVAGLFSSNDGRDFATVIGALRDAGFHYVEWRVFDSQFYGVAQRRRRVFIVGHVRNPRRYPLFVEREGGRGHSSESEQARQETAPGFGTSFDNSGIYGRNSFGGYSDGVATLTNSGHKRNDNIAVSGNLGSEIVGTLAASDHKFPQQQQAEEGKIVLQTATGEHVKYGPQTKVGNPELWDFPAQDVAPTLSRLRAGDCLTWKE